MIGGLCDPASLLLGKKFSPLFEYAAWLAPIPIWTSWNGRTIDCLCWESIWDLHDHRPRVLYPHSYLTLLYSNMYSEDYKLLTSSYNLMSLLLIPFRIPNSATVVLFGIVFTNVRIRGPETKSQPILRFQVLHFSVFRYLLFYIGERFPEREI